MMDDGLQVRWPSQSQGRNAKKSQGKDGLKGAFDSKKKIGSL
jgi:hypothetical protein